MSLVKFGSLILYPIYFFLIHCIAGMCHIRMQDPHPSNTVAGRIEWIRPTIFPNWCFVAINIFRITRIVSISIKTTVIIRVNYFKDNILKLLAMIPLLSLRVNSVIQFSITTELELHYLSQICKLYVCDEWRENGTPSYLLNKLPKTFRFSIHTTIENQVEKLKQSYPQHIKHLNFHIWNIFQQLKYILHEIPCVLCMFYGPLFSYPCMDYLSSGNGDFFTQIFLAENVLWSIS